MGLCSCVVVFHFLTASLHWNCSKKVKDTDNNKERCIVFRVISNNDSANNINTPQLLGSSAAGGTVGGEELFLNSDNSQEREKYFKTKKWAKAAGLPPPGQPGNPGSWKAYMDQHKLTPEQQQEQQQQQKLAAQFGVTAGGAFGLCSSSSFNFISSTKLLFYF